MAGLSVFVSRMDPFDLWQPDDFLGRPIRVGFRVGSWMYAGSVPIAVRLFRSDMLWGTGDYEDPPEWRDDRQVECYYLEFEMLGEQRWGSRSSFMSIEGVEEYGRQELGGTVTWIGFNEPKK